MVFDRYNWDKGKSVEIAGITITDRFMGEFHRQGLAQEFDCMGSFKRRFTWTAGSSIPGGQCTFLEVGRDVAPQRGAARGVCCTGLQGE
jgi:hypothetical protein